MAGRHRLSVQPATGRHLHGTLTRVRNQYNRTRLYPPGTPVLPLTASNPIGEAAQPRGPRSGRQNHPRPRAGPRPATGPLTPPTTANPAHVSTTVVWAAYGRRWWLVGAGRQPGLAAVATHHDPLRQREHHGKHRKRDHRPPSKGEIADTVCAATGSRKSRPGPRTTDCPDTGNQDGPPRLNPGVQHVRHQLHHPRHRVPHRAESTTPQLCRATVDVNRVIAVTRCRACAEGQVVASSYPRRNRARYPRRPHA